MCYKSLILIFNFFMLIYRTGCDDDSPCLDLEVSITQKIDNEGFHREIGWLIETPSPGKSDWTESGCKLVLRVLISNGMFVNPDEVADDNRTQSLSIFIDRPVDIEAPAHEATEHLVYIFLNNHNFHRTINLPVHLRYQRAQITGGYGKIFFQKPSLLAWCPDSLNKICTKGLKVEAPCDNTGHRNCVWKNVTYQSSFDDLELFVPVGDLDDYPLVSIFTLLLGCAGCIYILSVLSTTPL